MISTNCWFGNGCPSKCYLCGHGIRPFLPYLLPPCHIVVYHYHCPVVPPHPILCLCHLSVLPQQAAWMCPPKPLPKPPDLGHGIRFLLSSFLSTWIVILCATTIFSLPPPPSYHLSLSFNQSILYGPAHFLAVSSPWTFLCHLISHPILCLFNSASTPYPNKLSGCAFPSHLIS